MVGTEEKQHVELFGVPQMEGYPQILEPQSNEVLFWCMGFWNACCQCPIYNLWYSSPLSMLSQWLSLKKKKKKTLEFLQHCASAAQWGESAICIHISPPSWTYLPSTPTSHPYIPPCISSQSIAELPVQPVVSNYKHVGLCLALIWKCFSGHLCPSLPWSCVKQMTDRIWWINISALSFV